LSVALAAVLGLDWFLALRGALSYALTGAATLLVVPWALLLFSPAPRADGPGVPPAGAERRLPGHLLRLALLGAVVSLYAAKWLVLAHSDATSPEYLGTARSYTLLIALTMALGVAITRLRWESFLASVSNHPARLLASSFAATGFVGALLLSLPVAHENIRDLSLVDNLFMAFSAVCVTGLAVNNLAETYSLFGQGVLCLLVQVGGLGIMVLSAAIAMLAGQRLRVRSSRVLTETVDGASLANLRHRVATICGFTLLLEAGGILLLYAQFQAYPELATRHGHPLSGAGSVLWAAVFHGVSAFCNAGFSNLEQGLFPFRGHAGVMGVMTALIVLGGIGFPVLTELGAALWTKLRRRRLPLLTLHTRITLRLTALLLAGLALAYLALEWTHGLSPLSYHERILAAVFQAASARTAGFNVIDLSGLLPASLALTCAAMFIGAGSGSTAGGIKVTTAAALYSGLRAELTGTPPSLLNRVLPDGVIRKAIAVGVLSSAIVALAFFLLLLVESHPPLDLLFEVVSAFSTTGLSTGVTPKLSVAGKLLIVALMFIGRIGPLTLALAVSSKVQQRLVRFPNEPVLIG
jgi:trk system potassium uptake protein TrkH